MKMICDVPDEVIKSVKMGTWCGSSVAEKMIANGIPLPKVRGRLMILSEDRLKENQINLDWSCQKWISEIGLSNATVKIIKVDKAESEDEE